MWAKQSTAATVIIGPVLDSTGAEYASAVIGDLSISKNGGTLTALASAATLTLIANGQYTLVLTTANVDTLGRAQITCNKSTYQVPSIELMVLPATVYDAIVTNAVNATGGLVGATAAITTMAGVIATATNITAGTITTVTNLTNAPTSGDLTATMKSSVTTAVPTVASIQSGLSTLTQTQVTGGAYAINNASFAFNAGLDFTTTQKAATLARVTLVDTTTANTDMRGTNSAALAATALSTTQWTNTLATNIGTTNTTVAIGIDATISSRLASASYTAPSNLTAAQIATGVWQDATAGDFTTASSVGKSLYNAFTAGTSVFTVAALANAPSGGGGGDPWATVEPGSYIAGTFGYLLSTQIADKTDLIGNASAITSLLAAAVLEPGTITSFPETLTIGDSYTTANGRSIQIPIVDTDGTPISVTGTLYFADATATFTIKRNGETDTSRTISGTATFTDPPGTGTGDEAPYATIELLPSETIKGLIGYKYSGVLTFTWTGTGSDEDEVMSFETDTILFDN